MTWRVSQSTALALVLWLAVVTTMFVQTLPLAWSDPWRIASDDGRHFVVWLRALADPELFQGDPIAEYFGALTPASFKLLFLPAVWLGIDVMTWDLLVLAPLIVGLTVLSANRLLAQFLPDQLHRALCLALILGSVMDDVTNGLPRSFAYPILFAALSFFLERRLVPLALTLAVGANIYPVGAIVATSGIGMAALIALISERRLAAADPVLVATALVSTFAGLAVFMASVESTGATFTLAEATGMDVFGPGGRTAFFRSTWLKTVVCSLRGGYFNDCFGLKPLAAIAAHTVILTVAYVILRRRLKDPRPVRLMAGLLAGATIMYLVAYAVAFRAHLPTRYSALAFSFLVPLAFSLILYYFATLGPRLFQRALHVLILITLVMFVRQTLVDWKGNYVRDTVPALSNAIRDLPKDSIISASSPYANNVPTFTGRSVYVARELAIPYKREYHRMMSERFALQSRLRAGPANAKWRALLAETGVDYFVDSSDPSRTDGTSKISGARFQRSIVSEHPLEAAQCRVAREGGLDLIDASCLADLVVDRSEASEH